MSIVVVAVAGHPQRSYDPRVPYVIVTADAVYGLDVADRRGLAILARWAGVEP